MKSTNYIFNSEQINYDLLCYLMTLDFQQKVANVAELEDAPIEDFEEIILHESLRRHQFDVKSDVQNMINNLFEKASKYVEQTVYMPKVYIKLVDNRVQKMPMGPQFSEAHFLLCFLKKKS